MNTEFYFDYNATTPTDERVLAAMMPYFGDRFHNPSSFYRDAAIASDGIETARKQVASLLNCSPEEVFFTGGGTESDNIAIFGAALKLKDKGKHIITTVIEHPAVLESCKYLEKNGFEVSYLPVDEKGVVDPDSLKAALREDTLLVSIMMANNEIGVIQDLKPLIEMTKEKGALFHTDAVQAAGKIHIDVKELGLDMLSLSSHKIYGVKGVGVLYKRKGIRLEPLMFGGGHEKGIRPGTENVAGIVGTGKAAELAAAEIDNERERLLPLRERIKKELAERIPHTILNSGASNCLFNTVNFSIKHIEGEAILALLDSHGLAFSSGSACSSKSLDPSHVLLAIGLSHEHAHGSLRISLGRYTSEADVDKLIEVLPPIVDRLRQMSPFWNNGEPVTPDI